MRTYVMATGVAFGLLTAAHVWRLVEEGRRLLQDPWWIFFTVLALVFTVWALRLLLPSRSSE